MNLTKSKRLKRFMSVILSIIIIMSTMPFQLTAAYGKEEKITYAYTINYPIDLRNIGDEEGQTPAKGDGYEWDNETNTLTLNNLHIDFSDVEMEIGDYGIFLPSGLDEATIILNGANKITDISIINCLDIHKVTLKGGSGNRENDSLEVVCNNEDKYKLISALGLGRNSYIEDLTMKLDLYWGTNFTNLDIENSDITITSCEATIYCVGYFKAVDSNLYFKSEGVKGADGEVAGRSAIMANVAAFDGVAENKPYICDEPININNCKITAIAPKFASIYASQGNAVISDSTIDCEDSLVGFFIGDDITINNSDIKNSCLTLDSISGTISIDESSSVIGVSRERASKNIIAYGKYIQTDALNSNIIGEGYTFTIDETAEVTIADGFSMKVAGGKLINNGIVKGSVEKTSGTIECNNHCLIEIKNDETGTHFGKCLVCGEENIQAKEITFISGDNHTTVYISEPKLNKYLIPEVPTAENMKFECWSETKAENVRDDAKAFDFDSPITNDTTLYAVFSREFAETDELAIDLVYGQKINEPIHLSNYVKFADETFDTDELNFTVSSGAVLVYGLELNNDGTIMGTPMEDVREDGYEVEFIVTDRNPYISLATLEPEAEQEKDSKETVLTIKFNIHKANPIVTIKPTENLIYDTNEKVLIDSNNTSTNGGKIIYSLDNINYSDELPKATDANEYTIWYKVVGDNNYNDTEAKMITVNIAKGTPLYEIPENLTTCYGKILADVKLPNGFKWDDDTQSVGNIGKNIFKATYIPNDTDNYNIITDLDITVNVIAPEEVSPYGDLDGEIGVTFNDASCLLKKVLNNNDKMSIEEKVEEYIIYADVNGDGILTAADVSEILKKSINSNFKFTIER